MAGGAVVVDKVGAACDWLKLKADPVPVAAAGKAVDWETAGAAPKEPVDPNAAGAADWPKVGRADEKLNDEVVTAGATAAVGRDGDEPKDETSDDPKAGAAFDCPKVGAAAVAAAGCEVLKRGADGNPNPVAVDAGVPELRLPNEEAPPNEKAL